MSRSTLSTNPKYFEAVIQLRPYHEEVFAFIQKAVRERNHPEVFISRVVSLKTGVDIYMSSQRFARTLGQRLKQKFPHGELLITSKMHTWDRMRSRELSRATVLFRILEQKKEVEEE